MIAKHDFTDKVDIWSALSAPLPPTVIEWRQDGRPVARDGKYTARFVAYITANVVRNRLDAVVPGEYDSTLELLPPLTSTGGDGETNDQPVAFKCRIQILGVIREDVGTGKDYKQAATDAFKRAAVRFGIGSELYDMEHLWVSMDGDGKYAKPLEDPGAVYARKHGRAQPSGPKPVIDGQQGYGAVPDRQTGEQASGTDEVSHTAGPLTSGEESCPKCGGRVWDNRLTKRNPKAPDFKCRDRSCDGVIWPPKGMGSTKHGDDDTGNADEIPY